MRTVIDKADDKTSNDIDPLTAKFLINCCLTKKVLRFNSTLPKGKTIEEVTREGYAYIENSSSSLDVQLSVPFFNLFTWLKLDASVFGCAEHLFKFAWNDTNAIGPLAWEKFNVKYTSFKMTLLRDDESRTIPLRKYLLYTNEQLTTQKPFTRVQCSVLTVPSVLYNQDSRCRFRTLINFLLRSTGPWRLMD